MGARATIRVFHTTSDDPIHLYTHWKGHKIAEILAEGINKAIDAGRITDQSYATRIIFDHMTELSGDTDGFGIGIGERSQPGDVEFDTPTIIWGDESLTPKVIYRGREMTARDFADSILSYGPIPSGPLVCCPRCGNDGTEDGYDIISGMFIRHMRCEHCDMCWNETFQHVTTNILRED